MNFLLNSDDQIHLGTHTHTPIYKYAWFLVGSVDGYNVQCSSNFTAYGSNLTVSSTFFSSGSATFESCQQMCSDNTSCISFYHRSDTSECHMSKSSARISADCSSCSYYIKQCWQGTCTCISHFFLSYQLWSQNKLNECLHIFHRKEFDQKHTIMYM